MDLLVKDGIIVTYKIGVDNMDDKIVFYRIRYASSPPLTRKQSDARAV